ncbi:MAG: methyltransferase regulatory domain-containing protein, partial [Rickettsiaceae bacterium]|nr:methyltransferase regulatory domain-containing protein [Rickettsiaceae bacterium]
AKFVGVDLSKVQIDSGLKYIADLGLKNIELKHISITDIDKEFGKFDYIICHGVISWVPEHVRVKIFDICNENLSENGIAYVSYNTLPGWNMVRTIRDMMLYHSQNFADAREKIAQSRLLLDFIKESVKEQNTPYSQILEKEAELLSKQSDHYLRHDHLEEDNKQYYFNEFIGAANKRGLQYLADSSIASMYVGNMPQGVVEKLQGLNDIVKVEQYMDFITNRRFRTTLLCHKDVKLNRALNNDMIKNFTITFDIIPEKPFKDISLNSGDNLKFFYGGNTDNSLSTSSPALKAVLYVLAENRNNPLSYDKIVKLADKKLAGGHKQNIENELLNNLMNLMIKGYINLSSNVGNLDKVSKEKPNVITMAKYQANKTANNWVTNLRHTIVPINNFDKVAVTYMDGKNTKEQIIKKLLEDIKNNKFSVSKDGNKVEKEEDIKNEIEAFLEDTINRFYDNALLM